MRSRNTIMIRHPSHRRHRRRGVVSLWIILLLPVLLLLLCLLIEIGNLWLARVELENALESAALAAVKEWGDAAGGDTDIPRQVGQTYAAANTVTGTPVALLKNYSMAMTNGNLNCVDDLVFGAITNDTIPYEFNAGIEPGCGGAPVLFDASGQGNLQTAANNEWGIAFHETSPALDPALRIDYILINLRAGGGSGSFVGAPGPVLSSNTSPYLVRDTSGNEQPDIAGFTAPASQILFSFDNVYTLRITFAADGVNDDGFAPGDRFRFGADVEDVSSGSGSDDGDGIGRDDVGVTVAFNNALVATGTFFDNTESKNACLDPRLIDPVTGTFVVHPRLIPDLPCPPSAAGGNNGQSFVYLQAGGGDPFGVRAQATVPVQSVCCQLCGVDIGPFNVSACATAMYDCEVRLPRLIRVPPERFICPGP